MAETKESELKSKLKDRADNVGTTSWVNRHNEDKRAVERAKEALDSVFTEVLSHTSEEITQEEKAELRDPYSSRRFITAMEVLNRMEAKNRTPKSQPQSKKLTQGQTAENISDILQNPDKYGLSEAQQQEIAEIAWWTTGADNSLHPDNIDRNEIRRRLKEQKGNGEVTEEEVAAAAWNARRDLTVAHFTAVAAGENANLPSNSERDYDLYKLELGIMDLRSVSPDLLAKLSDAKKEQLLSYLKGKYPGIQRFDDAKEKIIESISKRVPAVGGLMMAGQGAHLFVDPKGYLTSRLVAKVGTKIATNTAANAALTAIAAAGGPAGWLARAGLALAQSLLGKFAGNFLNNLPSRLWNGGKKAIAGAVAIAALAATTLTASAGTFAASVFLILISLIPITAFITLIINNSGYLVPPSSPLIGGGPGGPGGPGTTPIPGGASCPNENLPKPEAVNVRYSSDHKYAFPLAPFERTYYTCGHWDGNKASDMGIVGISEKGWTGKGNIPVIAYTSGRIELTSLNDSLGGKYIILKGDDGRYYYYAHNCALYVTQGQRVTVGEVMATTDNTGSAANSIEHLHFAISNAPNFIYAGTICPSTDFEDKFALGRCSKAAQCPPL